MNKTKRQARKFIIKIPDSYVIANTILPQVKELVENEFDDGEHSTDELYNKLLKIIQGEIK